MKILKILGALAFLAIAIPSRAQVCAQNFDDLVCFHKNVTIDSGATLTVNGTFAGCAALATDALAGATATTMALGNTVSTAVSIGNSAACDTITIGTNTDADAITVGDTTDTTVLVSNLWAIPGTGIATFPSVDCLTAGTFGVGNTTATTVSIGNSAAADTITIGTNADADAISIGDSLDTVQVAAAIIRVKSGTTFTAADPNPTKATLQAAHFFLVDTSSNAVDLDFADDAALDAADVGAVWTFVVSAGGTNALTVTVGASGVTTVVALSATTGTSAEDVGDMIQCTAFATTKITCVTYAAD